MRSTFVIALVMAAAMAPSAGAAPPKHCDPGPCLDDRVSQAVNAAQECVANGSIAIREVLEGTSQPQTCGPF
jgi:hypothetical protein